MITYGIDAHLLLRTQKDGVPRYAECLLTAMMAQPLGEDERVVLYANAAKPDGMALAPGWVWKELRWPVPRGWTHGRLSLEMVLHPPNVLFVPGHEVPMFMRKRTVAVTTLHDIAFKTVPEVYEPAAVRRQELAMRRAIKRAEILLTPSVATKNDIVREYHVDADRIAVTPLAPTIPVSRADAADVLRKYSLSDGHYVFAMGRLEKKKNTLLLVRAFAAVKRKFGHAHPLTLVLAGQFGFGEREIRRAMTEEHIETDVRILGYVSDEEASLLLSHARCFAFPSRAEGFGIPILEAMAHGTPIIASNIPSTREVASDAALLVSHNDIAAFARGIESLVLDAALCERYRDAGYSRVHVYSWTHCAAETWRALRATIR